ncbi:MAG: carbohydrate binding domain-containing protein [Gorillibacterium sp.]|nr:carbohydrate binding domain-containing protein [Gorillibacterium sp.]
MNGQSLAADEYSVFAGRIILTQGVFAVKGDYTVEVAATGYHNASVIQKVGQWALVWNDEFTGTGSKLDTNGVDLSKWGYQLGTGSQYGLSNWGNDEKQSYRADNIRVNDGLLVIEPKKEDQDGMHYTSGRLYTQDTFSKAYGRFEAKMKLPQGSGFWPAFWMMPTSSVYGGWPVSGEIDIMEARGRVLGQVGGALHYGKTMPNNKSTAANYQFAEGTDITAFHEYAVEWEPGELRWYVDGNLFQTVNNWSSWGENQAANYSFPAPFDQDFHMILNLAIGGNFDGGNMPQDSDFPASMEVDYVRAYDLTGIPYHTPVEPKIEAEPLPAGHKAPVDGNYVHDPIFSQPITEITQDTQALDPKFWNFLHISTFLGAGTISTEQLEGSPYAKTTITAGGNAVHAVQLIQNVTLGKGRWYKLTFDAKSDANRSLSVKLSGGADRGWSTYSDVMAASLTSSLKSYEMIFQMTADTDVLARLEFNMGQNTSPVWIGNVKLIEVDALDPYLENSPKEPINGNHVYNGTFDLGRIDRMTYWDFNLSTDAAAQATVSDERNLHVAITNGGADQEAIKLVQPGMNLLSGNDYKISFKAKADAARTINLGMRKQDGTDYIEPQSVSLTTTMEEHTVLFTMNQPTDVQGVLTFLLGGQLAGVTLDDVQMVRLTEAELPLVAQFPVKNGDFSNGKTSWSEHVQGRYDWGDNSTAFNADNGELDIFIANVGGVPWDVMLMQTDFQLYKGKTYIVTMDAHASISRSMELVVDINGGTTRVLSEPIALTTDVQTFRFELPVQADITASLKLLLGKQGTALDAHHVIVDNVHVELKGAREQAFLLHNGDFTSGLTSWTPHVQGVYEGPAKGVAKFTTDNGVLKAAIANAGAESWNIMLFQDSLKVIKDNTYVVSFTARSSVPRSIEVVAENSSPPRFLNQQTVLSDTTKDYQYEFTMDKDETLALKFLLGKQDGSPEGAHDVFLDNIRFERKGAQEATGEKTANQTAIRLPAPPELLTDESDNAKNEDIELTFADQPDWRNAISAVFVEGSPVDADSYTVSSGKIVLKASLFPAVKTYTIVIKANGYELAELEQAILAESVWSLVWRDEFNGDGTTMDTNGVDLDKWAYQNGNGSEYGVTDWGNAEQEYYQSDNVSVDNGHLLIEARKEAAGGKDYTSGRLWTSPTFSKKYGKFEARMKLPAGKGFWPAFWLMPKDSEYGGWASSGEIDIMEAKGRVLESVGGTLHYGMGYPNNKYTGSNYVFPAGDSITGFHTYTVEWEPGEIRWYVDGTLYQTINEWYSQGSDQPDKYAFPAPFDKEFYIILNLAIGGNFDGGVVPDASMFPATMDVDYVRVYELTGRAYKEPVEPFHEKEQFPDNGKLPVDGNLVYDPDYEQGLTDITTLTGTFNPLYWNFLHVPDYGGVGSVSVEPIGEDPFAKVQIISGGTAVHALQLLQYVTLTKGNHYKISFDAKSSASRTASLKFGGDADNGWANYSNSFIADLTTQIKHYGFSFQMLNPTDIAARLEFNLGLDANPVWIGNVIVEEVEQLDDPNGAKAPLNSGGHVYNGSFDLGKMDRMKYWTFALDGATAQANVDAVARELKVDVQNGGSAPDAIKLVQKGINLLQTDKYVLSFDARAATDRSIEVAFRSKDGQIAYTSQQQIALDTAMHTYTFTFTMPVGVTDTEGQLVFGLGGDNADVWLDDIKLIRTTNNNVDYTGVQLFPLKNGDFSLGLAGWVPFVQGGNAVFSGSDGQANISITNTGTAEWNVMLNQEGLSLTKGMLYVLSFDASSTAARDLSVTVEDAAYTRYFSSGAVMISPDRKHYEYFFRMTANSITTLKMMMGKTVQSPTGPHIVTIDNVVLEVAGAPVKRPPTLIQDSTDNKIGQSVELRFTDDEAWRTAIASVEVNGLALATGQYELQAGSILLNAEVFNTDTQYIITIKANGYGAVSVTQTILPQDGNLVLNGSMSDGLDNWIHWKGDGGDSAASVENGAAKIEIYSNGGMHPEWNVPVSWSTQFNQTGIKLSAGKSYELNFRAWSTVNRPIALELDNHIAKQTVNFNLTDDQAIIYSKSIQNATDVLFDLKFLLGNVIIDGNTTPSSLHTIYIDDVTIREVVAAPQLVADTTENKVGQHIELAFADQPEWRNAITSIVLDGATIPTDKYKVEAGKITLDASLFQTVKSFLIVVKATGYGDAEVTQIVKTAAANIALHKTATASSNKQPAANAVDGLGVNGTRWESDSSDPQWIAVDLGSQYRLEGVVLNWEGAYGKGYRIQVSSVAIPGEADWKDVYTEANGNGGMDSVSLTDVEGRHIRVYGTTRGTTYGYSLWELEAYGVSVNGPGPELKTPPTLTADASDAKIGNDIDITFAANLEWEAAINAIKLGDVALTPDIQYTVTAGKITLAASLFSTVADYQIVVDASGYQSTSLIQTIQGDRNLALNMTVTASTYNTVMKPINLTDGDKNTRWEALWESNNKEPYFPEWVVIDLGEEQTVSRLLLTWEAAYSKAFDIQVALATDDPSVGSEHWKTVKSVNRELTVNGKQEEAIGLDDEVKARYIRLFMTEKGYPPYGPSLFEVEVY